METDYQSFFENAVEGIYRTTPGGKFLLVNHSLAQMFGYASPQELIDSITDIGEQMYAEPGYRKEILRLVRKNGRVDDFEIQGKRKDGSTTWVSVSLRSVPDKTGRIRYLEGFMRDINARKQAEKALQESQAQLEQVVHQHNAELVAANEQLQKDYQGELRFRTLSENAMVGVYIIQDGRFSYVNHNLASIFGYETEELIGADPLLVVHPDDQAMVSETMRLRLRGEAKETPYEFRGRCKNGDTRLMEVRGSAMLLNDRPAIMGNIRDVTDRNQAEARLQESTRELIESQRISGVGTFSLEVATGILTTSEMLDEIFGYAKGQPHSIQDWESIIHPDDRPIMLKQFKQNIIGKKQPYDNEYRIIRQSDQSVRWVHGQGKPVLDARGRLVKVQGIARDITESKLAQEDLRESEERYKTIFQNSNAAMLIVDPATTAVVDANQAAVDYYGWSREELLQKRVDQINTLSPEKVLIEIKRAREHKQNYFIFKHRRADGSIRDVEVYSSPMMVKGRTLLYSIIHDVTERKQAEDALLVSEQAARQTASQLQMVNQIGEKINSGLGFDRLMQTIYEQCLQIGFANTFYVGLYDHASNILKLPVYFSEGQPVYRPPVNLVDNPGIASHVIKTHKTIYVPDIHHMPPGMVPHTISPTPTQTRSYLGIPLILNDQVVGVLSMQSSLPEAYTPDQVKTLELLATQVAIAIQNSQLFEQVENERNLATAVIENLPGAVGLIDRQAHLLRWNRQAEIITGYSLEEMRGLNFQSLFTAEDVARLPDLVSEVFRQGHQSVDVQVISKDGRRIPINMTATRVHIGNDDQMLFIGMDITERKRSERRLLEVMAAVEATSDAIGISDAQGRHFYQNKAMTNLLGYKTAEDLQAVGGGPAVVKDPEVARQMYESIQHGNPWVGELDVVTREGRVFRGFERANAIKDEAGTIIGLIGIITDISERKKMEQDILQNEAIFSSFMQNSPVYVFFKDKDTRALRLSKNYEQMLGMPVEQALGKTMDELFPSDLSKSMVADDLRILREGRRVDVVERLNGRIYETTKFPIFKDGKPDMLAGFTIDVTERMQAEQALHEAEAFNQAIITHSPIGISVRSRTGELLSANSAWLKIWSIREEEYQAMLQEKFKELVFDERDKNLEGHEQEVRRVFEQGGSLYLPDLKTRYHRPGDAEWVSQYYYAILDEKNQVTRVVTLTEDISARKKAEAEIIKSQARLERVQEVAHMGSFEINLTTRQVTANDEACRIYGVEPGGLTLEKVQSFVLKEFRPAMDAALAALVQGLADYDVDFKIKRVSDGAIRDIHSLAEYDPETRTMIGSIQDITERKRSEQELKDQLDMLERMNNVMVDRELRMLEIKKEVNALLVKAGQKEKYRVFDL